MALPANTKLLGVCMGAPNFILEQCAEQLMADGSSRPMTEDIKKQVLGVLDEYSSRALRVLAIATRTFEAMPFSESGEDLTTHQSSLLACRDSLCLLGFVASIDPDRDGVPESVVAARQAGIRVVMINGVCLFAAAIARSV